MEIKKIEVNHKNNKQVVTVFNDTMNAYPLICNNGKLMRMLCILGILEDKRIKLMETSFKFCLI